MPDRVEQTRPGFYWDRILERHVPETYPGQLHVCKTCEDTTFIIVTDSHGIQRSRKCEECRDSVAERLSRKTADETKTYTEGMVPTAPKPPALPSGASKKKWYED